MNRGMTLIETLLALTLLSALAVAAFSWTSLSARASDDARRLGGWQRAAREALAFVDESLLEGDDVHSGDRVLVVANELRIRSRRRSAGGFEWRVLTFDASQGVIYTSIRVSSDDTARPADPEAPFGRRLVLGSVSSAAWQLDRPSRTLAVSLVAAASVPGSDSLSQGIARTLRVP